MDNIEQEILTTLKSKAEQEKSYKEMLMLSFVLYITDMSEVELMDFQMETLGTIKRIKQRRMTDHQNTYLEGQHGYQHLLPPEYNSYRPYSSACGSPASNMQLTNQHPGTGGAVQFSSTSPTALLEL